MSEIESLLRRQAAVIARQRRSLHTSLVRQTGLVNQALSEGVAPKVICRITGLTPGRISQMRNEES